jgi:peptide deformylase
VTDDLHRLAPLRRGRGCTRVRPSAPGPGADAYNPRVTIAQIRLFGDPILRTRADEVTEFDKELRTLVGDLTDTMLDAPGAGLAAPQIGVGLRVFTWHVDGRLGHLVNPVLDLSTEEETAEEGCLSFPGLRCEVTRAYGVVARGQDMHGEPVVVEGSQLLARAIQHETDHLDGVLFIDRLDPQARREAMRIVREAEWSGAPVPAVRVSPHATFGRGR